MDTSLLPLAYLLPAGLLCAAWSSLPNARLRESAAAAAVIAVSSAVAYIGFGFALQFGGVGLSAAAPAGLRGLDKAWSPFPAGAGQWSFIGLEGFFASAQGSPDSLALIETLALHRLPMAIVAGLIPIVALDDRAHRVARIAAGLVAAAVVFPIGGAWVWGAGWLEALGRNLNLGHGAIDVAGSGSVFLAAASVALVTLRLLGRTAVRDDQEVTLPVLRQPLLALLGAVMFGAGWSAWTISDPLLADFAPVDISGVIVIGFVSAVTAMLAAGAYIWLVTGRIQLLPAMRGWLAGWVAAGASAWFIPPGSAVAIGAVAALVSIIGQYVVEFKWGLNDRAGMLATYGAAGAWGLIAVAIFADGAFGSGWNDVMAASGVRGILASDPGQLTAQLATLAAIGALAFCAAALLLWPLSIIARRSSVTPAYPAARPTALTAPPSSVSDTE